MRGQEGGKMQGRPSMRKQGKAVGMEGIHRAETLRRRRRAKISVCGAQVPCPRDASQMSGQVVTSASPMSPTSPAPPIPFPCSHVSTWRVAPTAPTASSGPCEPSVPCCSRQESQAAQEKGHVGTAAAEKRAPVESAFMAASTESLSLSGPAPSTPVGRAAPAALPSMH